MRGFGVCLVVEEEKEVEGLGGIVRRRETASQKGFAALLLLLLLLSFKFVPYLCVFVCMWRRPWRQKGTASAQQLGGSAGRSAFGLSADTHRGSYTNLRACVRACVRVCARS